jgi:hypothetical protein
MYLGIRFLVSIFQDSLSPISPFSLHALCDEQQRLEPRKNETKKLFRLRKQLDVDSWPMVFRQMELES